MKQQTESVYLSLLRVRRLSAALVLAALLLGSRGGRGTQVPAPATATEGARETGGTAGGVEAPGNEAGSAAGNTSGNSSGALPGELSGATPGGHDTLAEGAGAPGVGGDNASGASGGSADQTGAAPAAPPAAAATPALALAAPSELLDSYRISASYIITSLLPDGERRVDSTQLQGAWKRSAGRFGFDAAFTLTNVSGSRRQALGVVALGEAVAIQSDGAWSTIARDESLPYGDPDQLLSLPFIMHVNRGEDLGQEALAGVNVTHYRLSDPHTFAEAVGRSAPGVGGSVRDVLLEGWVADAGYVVKYLLQAEWEDAQILDESGSPVAAAQQVSAAYVLSDLDAVGRIEWPADAQPPNTVSVPGFVPNTFPLPEGAQVTPRLGMVEIRTEESDADVAAFYRARLLELGWRFEGELGFYSAEKDGQRIRLTILPDEVTGATVVRVFGAGD